MHPFANHRLLQAALASLALCTPFAHAQTATPPDPAAALATKSACTTCHAPDRKSIGPSWKDIATKYADGSRTDQQLAQSIRKGGAGNWGSTPMPPQASLAEADALVLARWVLAAKR